MTNNFSWSEAQLFNQNNLMDCSEVQKHNDSYNDFGNNFPLNHELKNEKSFDFMQFLRINFALSENFDEIIPFLREYPNLIDVICPMPNLFDEEFPNDLLEMKIISRIDEEEFLVIIVHTTVDGFSASKKIEKIEDGIYNQFGNVFEKIIISVEFFK